MSNLFRTKECLPLAQLSEAWSSELAADGEDPRHCERNLVNLLKEDIINGRLDNSGPLREGRRLGLRLITDEWKAGFVEGTELFVPIREGHPWVLHRVALMKEAVLDFAQRRRLPSPSWWVDSAGPPEVSNETNLDTIKPHSGEVPSRALGKQPRITEYLKAHHATGVPDPGLCPRHVLKADLLKWDPDLKPLDDATLKKAIETYNAGVARQQLDPK
jgi:hypothetical protein